MLTKLGRWIVFILVLIISIAAFFLSKGNDTRGALIAVPIIALLFLCLFDNEPDTGRGGYA